MIRRLRPVDVWLNGWLKSSPLYRHDQTLSQHAALARNSGHRLSCFFCRILDLFERDHCTQSLRDY